MVTPVESECFLVATLVSSAKRDVCVKMVDLHVNPDYESFFEKVEMVTDQVDQVVKPRESLTCVFKVKVGKMPIELE